MVLKELQRSAKLACMALHYSSGWLLGLQLFGFYMNYNKEARSLSALNPKP